jgi:prepilin-type processing-associated H-X9-DG protein
MKPTSYPELIKIYAPTAKGQGRGGYPDAAWGIFKQMAPDYRWPVGMWGSYAGNQWVCNQAPGRLPEPQTGYWRTADVKGASRVPIMADGRWPYGWSGPYETQEPPYTETSSGSGENGMAKYCVNRHDGAVNGLFMDFSVRKIGLKELWTRKWHRLYDTEGPYTLAGGVTEDMWPQWIRNYKDY